jgi:dTDP-4-dehydrorhamnose reductase
MVWRTSWVVAPYGRNFVLTMLNAGRKTDRLRVVADQRGCPTAAPALAGAILQAVRRIRAEGWQDEWRGIYHAAGGGEATWHGLAVAVFEEAARFGVAPPAVEPIATADWPTPVRRPPDSRLDCGKLADTFGIALPPWRDSLRQMVEHIFIKAR